MFGGQNIILLYYTTGAENKKLYCGSVGDKNFSFYPVHWPSVCPVPQ
jgi:hypothetical protein